MFCNKYDRNSCCINSLVHCACMVMEMWSSILVSIHGEVECFVQEPPDITVEGLTS